MIVRMARVSASAPGAVNNPAPHRGNPWSGHLALIAPLFAVLFVLIKAYVVAQFSLTTAGALVSAAPLSVLVGTITSYLNVTIILATALSAAWLILSRTRYRAHLTRSVVVDSGVFATSVAGAALFPVPNLWGYYTASVLYVLGGATACGLIWWASSTPSRLTWFRWMAWVHQRPHRLVILYFAFLLAPTLRSAWVPAEVLVLRHTIAISDSHLKGGALQRTKYPVVFVLSDDGPWITVMDVRSKVLMRLPTQEVAHRQVCHYTGQPPNSVPLAAYLIGVRFHSPNSFCATLIKDHERRLDPLVVPESSQPATPSS